MDEKKETHIRVPVDLHRRLWARRKYGQTYPGIIEEVLDVAEYHEAHCLLQEEQVRRPERGTPAHKRILQTARV